MPRPADPKARSLLLAAAEQVFGERGLEDAKVEEIAKRAGLAKGSFYLHFHGKEDAFLQIVESFLSNCTKTCDSSEAIFESGTTAKEILRQWRASDRQMFEYFWENRTLLRLVASCNGPHEYLLQSFRAKMIQNCERALKFGQDRKLYRKQLDVKLIAHLFFGAYDSIIQRAIHSKSRPPLDRWLSELQEFLTRAIGTPSLIAELSSELKHSSKQTAASALTYRSRIKPTLQKGSHG